MKNKSSLIDNVGVNLTSKKFENEVQKLYSTIEELNNKIKSLEYEQLMFHQLLSAIPDNVYFKDRKSRFTILSQAMIDWFGEKKIENVIGKTDFDMFTDEHAKEAFEDEQHIMDKGVSIINKEEKETWEGGKITWVSTSKVPVRATNGKIIGIVGISRDITEKKRTETILKEYQQNLENAKRETDNILATVEEGLFLLDKDLKIGSQYSQELKSIIADKDPANKNFIKIFEGKIEKSLLNSVKDYFDLMFDKNHDETMLIELNPLVETEFKFGKTKKYLTFKFRRVNTHTGNIDQLIAIVTDVTKEINLSRILKEQEAESKRKMEWLLCILNIDPTMLKEFIASVHEELVQMEYSYKVMIPETEQLEAIDNIYRSMHTIKGGARLLEMDFFAELAHSAEDEISSMRTKSVINQNSLKRLGNQINSIKRTYNELKELIDHIGKIHDQFRPKRSHEHQLLLNTLDKLVKSLNTEFKKNVIFDYSNLDGNTIPFQRRLIIRDILVQLIRNSMYHGIESRPERKKLNKSGHGKIKISGSAKDNAYFICYEDDGNGLDLKKLEQKVRKSGIWSEKEINDWSKEKLYETIFHPGITTTNKVNLTAGRGMGMSIIRTKLEKIGGEIMVDTEPGKFTRFEILIPLSQEA